MSQKPTLKPPTKLARPSGPAPAKSSTNISQAGIKQTSAPEARPATGSKGSGLALGVAEQYASDLLRKASSTTLTAAASTNTEADDVFKIGDCVWVGGTKPGVIAFMGETKFAAGEWVGVILDAFQGKNDGSVSGVRYFTCEPLKGVFAKSAKLSRHPAAEETGASVSSGASAPVPDAEKKPIDVDAQIKTPPVEDVQEAGIKSPDVFDSMPTSELSSPVSPEASDGNETLGSNEASTPTHASPDGKGGFVAPTHKVPKTLAQSKPVSRLPKSNMGSTTSLNQLSLAGSSVNISQVDTGEKHNLKVGDKVIVSGNKKGILRYVGTTQFAEGEWAGVELEEALGKNDGSVGGKRYFKCVPMFGLFAPIAKVARLQTTTAGSRRLSTTSTSSRVPVSTLTASRERSGSQESISSLSSATSSASRTRVRLGVTSLANQASKLRSVGSTPVSESPLQKALKEKEEHVDQLLMERDLERSEVARTAAHAEEVETKMAALTVHYERLFAESDEATKKLRVTVEHLEKEKAELVIQVEDEKRKVEDLQFTIEEASIDKGDLETQTESDARKLRDITVKLEQQTLRANVLSEELSLLKARQTPETASKADLLGSAIPPLSTDDESKVSSADDRIKEYVEQGEVLKEQLKEKEKKEKELEREKTQLVEEMTKLNAVVISRDQRVTDLETALTEEKTNLMEVKSQLEQKMQDLSSSESMQRKHEQNINELMSKLVSSETTANSLYGDITKLNAQVADLQLQLQHNGEKYHHLEQDKSALEQRMSDLMNSSGDSSQQLKIITDQLQDSDRKASELESELSLSIKKGHELNEKISMQLKEIETMKLESLESKGHVEKLEDMLKGKEAMEVENVKNLAELKEQWEKERGVLVESKEKELAHQLEELGKVKSELEQVRAELVTVTADHVKGNETAEDAAKKFTMQVEQLRATEEESKKAVSSLELEKVRLNEDLAKALADVEQLTTTKHELEKVSVTLESRVKEMQDSIASLDKEKNELHATSEEKMKEYLESISRLEKERNEVQVTLTSNAEDLQQRIVLLEKEKSQLQEIMENQERDLKGTITQLETEKIEILARMESKEKDLNQTLSQLEIERKQLKESLDKMESKEKDLNQTLSQLEIEKKQLKESLDKQVGEQQEVLLKLETAVHENEAGAVAQKEASKKIAHLSQQVDALTKDLAINKGEVKEIEEVRKMLEEEKEKEIAQRQKELDQVMLDLEKVKGDLVLATAGHRKETETAEENLKKLTAELEQLRVIEKELKSAVSALEVEKVKLSEDLATALADVTQLTTVKHDLESSKVMMESKVKDVQDSFSSLEKEKEDLQLALKNSSAIQDSFSKLEKEKIEVETSFESKVKGLEESISRLEKERNDLKVMLENSEKKWSGNVSQFEEEKSELWQKLESKDKELVENISKFEKEISDQRISLEDKAKEMLESNLKLETVKDELQVTLQSKEKELIETVARFEKEENAVQASLESEVSELKESISKLEMEKNAAEVSLKKNSDDKDTALASLGTVSEQKEAAVNSLKEANAKVIHLSQQIDALTKDLAINKGEVKEIEEVRKMLEEEKEKVIAQRQEELDQVRSEMDTVKVELLRVMKDLETAKADSIRESENTMKLTAELDQLRVTGDESKNVISSLELEKVKLSEELAKALADVEQLSASERALENTKVTLETKFKEMQDSISSFEKEKNELQVSAEIKRKDLLEEKSRLEKDRNDTQMILESKVKEMEHIINKLKLEKNEFQLTSDSGAKALQESTIKLEDEKFQLQVMLDKVTAAKQDALTSLEELNRDKETASDAAKEANEKIVRLSEEIDVMRGERAADKDAISQLTTKLETVEAHSTDRPQDTETFKKTIAELEKSCETLMLENRSFSLKADKLQTLEAEKEQLFKEVTLLEGQIAELSQGKQKELGDLETERNSMLKKMEDYKVDNNQKTSLVEKLYKEVGQLTADKNSNHNNIQRLELEVSSLQKRIVQLESVTKAEQKTNGLAPVSVVLSSNSNTPQLQEDVENHQAQIEFLNSVIVDIQRKNLELQAKLDSVMANGFTETGSDIDISASSSSMITSKVAPRLFCDICDVFDLHDTDDCPKQAMSSPDSPPPSMHHGNRNDERLYCDICEVFGHSTDKCDDEQTF